MKPDNLDIYEIITEVRRWYKDRGLMESSNPLSQCMKVVEEVGELVSEINRVPQDLYIHKDLSNNENIQDAVGDIIISLMNFCNISDISLTKCANSAYNQIKDRQGESLNGRFIKEHK